jgi:hypothetical protein
MSVFPYQEKLESLSIRPSEFADTAMKQANDRRLPRITRIGYGVLEPLCHIAQSIVSAVAIPVFLALGMLFAANHFVHAHWIEGCKALAIGGGAAGAHVICVIAQPIFIFLRLGVRAVKCFV